MILSPDARGVAQDVVFAEEAHRKHLVVALSGDHAYGFPSQDSNLDLKGIHVAPSEKLLGLRPRSSSIEFIRVVDDVELDYSSNELGGVLLGILKGNGNYLERVLGQHVLHATSDLSELKSLVQGSLSRRCYRHYRGFAWQQRKELESQASPTLEKLLYVLRTALTGVHLLRSGHLVADLSLTGPEHGYADALELIEARKAGEVTTLDEARAAAWMHRLDGLFTGLDDAVIGSPLPLESPNEADFEEWLVELRLRHI